jgi:hypothetical protein
MAVGLTPGDLPGRSRRYTAILALLGAGELEPARRGVDWRAAQLPDGGWPPHAGFDESTWVTALVALLPPGQLGNAAHARAIDWLLDTGGLQLVLDHGGRMVSPQFESRCTMLRSIAQGLAGLVPAEWNRSQISAWPWRKILSDAALLAVLAVLSSWLIRR